ncbi:Digeranylgeranylglyceryl phosphate synthase [uncultured archaeon]|nr:Digeranylgeranylglyceryl phosphate synthase [uncultured archaeon]
MVKVKDFLDLLRVGQWYKNLMVFVPLIFSLKYITINLFILNLLGFFALCFISSSYYIINDVKDVEKDRHHPEKNKRPIVSGRISKGTAILISVLLFVDSLTLSWFLSPIFFLFVLGLFLSSQLYNFFLREVAFFDIIIISTNFIIRTVSAIFLLNIQLSYWIILCAFFLSIFLVSGKRIAETEIKELQDYRKSLLKEHKQTLNLMATISVAAVIIFFSIYSILTSQILLLISLPISFYLILLYFNGVYHHPEKIRNPEKFIFDKKIIISLILWFILVVSALYFSGNFF